MSQLDHTRSLYQKEERQKIIDYIIQKNIYFQLRGKRVWQNMEELNICPGRTWQSMKQHFKTSIIQSLDSFNITEPEKTRILYCYYYNNECNPAKRKMLPIINNNEDGNHENAFKKSKTQSSCYTSEVTKSSEEINDCNRNTQMEDCVDEQIIDDDEMEFYSSVEDPYSEEEDRKILIYVRENMNWTNLQFFNEIYENCQRCILPERSVSSIKKRFLNVILPNIYKYRIVEYDEIPLFYDRAGVEIPPNFEQILENFMKNNAITISSPESNTNSLEDITCFSIKNKDSEDSNTKVNKSKTEAPINFLVDFVPEGLCIHIKNKKHVFISNDSNETVSVKKDLKENLKMKNYNIHYINKKSYNDLLTFKKHHDLLDINNKKLIESKQLKLLSKILNEIESLQIEQHKNLEKTCKYNDDELEAPINNLSKNVEKCDINKTKEIDIENLSNHSSPIISMLGRRKMNIINTDSLMSKEICIETTSEANILVNDHLNITRGSGSSNVHCEVVSDSVNHEYGVKEISETENKIDGEEINLPTLTENLNGSCSEVQEKTISKIEVDDVVNDSSENVIFSGEKLSQQSLDNVLVDINLPKILENLKRSCSELVQEKTISKIGVDDENDSSEDVIFSGEKLSHQLLDNVLVDINLPEILEKPKWSSEEELNTVQDEIDSDNSDIIVLDQKSNEDKQINNSDRSNKNKEVKAEIKPPALLGQVKYTNEEEIQIKYEPVLETKIDIAKEDVAIGELLIQQILKEESDHFKAEPIEEYEPKLFETILLYSVVEHYFEVKKEEQEIDNNVLFPENSEFQIKGEDPLDTSFDIDIKKIELKEDVKDEIDSTHLT